MPDTPQPVKPVGVVYVAMVNDRHADPEANIFMDRDAAIAWARQAAQEYAYRVEDYEEPPVPAGWLFLATYSSVEGDCIWVEERKVLG